MRQALFLMVAGLMMVGASTYASDFPQAPSTGQGKGVGYAGATTCGDSYQDKILASDVGSSVSYGSGNASDANH